MSTGRNVSPPAILLGVLLLTSAGSGWAGLNEWTTQGPPGAEILTLAISLGDPSILLAGTRGRGVFKSLDGGTSWNAVNAGLPEHPDVRALAIEPGNPRTVYAGAGSAFSAPGNGVYKSLDGGTSWTYANAGLPELIAEVLVIDPASPSTLYAVAVGKLFKSVDASSSWTQLSNGLIDVHITTLVMDPVSPATLYAGADRRRPGLFKSTDGGDSWTQLPDRRPVSKLAIAARNPNVLVATTGPVGSRVIKSVDGGATWRDASTGLPSYGAVLVLAIDPVDPSTFYAGTAVGVLFKSVDGGASWAEANEGLTELDVDALAIDPADPSTLYAGTNYAGVFKSSDGGASWNGAHAGLPNAYIRTVAVAAANPSTVYAVARGIFKRAGSTSWTDLSTRGRRFSTANLVIDPTRPSTLFAGLGHGVSKSIDGAVSWVEVVRFRDAGVLTLAIDPGTGSTLYASILSENGAEAVFKGVDGGTSWSRVSGIEYADSLAIDPQNPSTVYAGSHGVFKSVDDGATWSDVSHGLPEGDSISALAIDPTTPTTVYAIAFRSGPRAAAGLFKSLDGGASWNAADNGLPEYSQVTALVIDPDKTSTLYTTTSPNRVFKSVDAGAFWTELDTAPVPADIETLAIDPANPSTLFVGTDSGVFNLTQADCDSPSTLCLKRGRFVVEADWRDFAGATGPARVVPYRTEDSGLLWFFDADNWEMLVKTLDGCGFNDHFWVFAAATTNVEYTLRVTDTLTGATKTYFNPLGNAAAAITDTRAFYACDE